jgi:hypothetical protein
MQFRESIATTGSPPKIEQEARKPSEWEWFFVAWLACSVVGLGLGVWASLDKSNPLPIIRNWTLAGIFAPWLLVCIVCCAMAAYGFGRHAIWTIETWRKLDIDGDGMQGQPQERLLTIRGGIGNPSTTQRMTIAEFVRLCDSHGTAWHSTWAQTGLISQDEWETKRNVLIGSGHAAWINPQFPTAGWRLTASSDTIIKAIG